MEQTYCGTPLYCCPQILQNVSYSRKCDIWSTGCLIYEALFGVVPFYAKSEVALVEKIMEGKLEVPKENCEGAITEQTRELLLKMLASKEEDRYNWMQIKLHPALKSLKVKYLQ